jgi:hypothetical protein
MKKIILITFLLVSSLSIAQISSKWDNYYDKYPSGIQQRYSSSDFIDVMEQVGFVPSYYKVKGDTKTFKKVLLSFPTKALKQMSISGNYYSRTIKHDDYFQLYNLTYKPVSATIWRKFSPYLIPLMEVDQLIDLN